MTIQQYIFTISHQYDLRASKTEGLSIPEINMELISKAEKRLGLIFIQQRKEGNLCFAENNDSLQDEYKQVFTSIDLLDYFYAVFHSSEYTKKYKIDFSQVHYPVNSTSFWKLVKWGKELRTLHLLENPVIENYITQSLQKRQNE